MKLLVKVEAKSDRTRNISPQLKETSEVTVSYEVPGDFAVGSEEGKKMQTDFTIMMSALFMGDADDIEEE